MSTAEDTDGAPAEASGTASPKSGKGRSNLLPALVVAGGLAAGGWFVGGAGADPVDEPSETTEAPTVEEGEVVELEPLTVNLADGRYLRVGVAYLTTEELEPVEDEDGYRFSPGHESRLRDQIIAMFSGSDGRPGSSPEDLDAVRDELLERANRVLDDRALEAYLTELVVQ